MRWAWHENGGQQFILCKGCFTWSRDEVLQWNLAWALSGDHFGYRIQDEICVVGLYWLDPQYGV